MEAQSLIHYLNNWRYNKDIDAGKTCLTRQGRLGGAKCTHSLHNISSSDFTRSSTQRDTAEETSRQTPYGKSEIYRIKTWIFLVRVIIPRVIILGARFFFTRSTIPDDPFPIPTWNNNFKKIRIVSLPREWSGYHRNYTRVVHLQITVYMITLSISPRPIQ